MDVSCDVSCDIIHTPLGMFESIMINFYMSCDVSCDFIHTLLEQIKVSRSTFMAESNLYIKYRLLCSGAYFKHVEITIVESSQTCYAVTK